MRLDFYSPQPLDQEEYERGYEEGLRAEPFTLFSFWISASWRAGRADGKRDGKEAAAKEGKSK